jgi:hypothetical protein
MRNGRYGDEYSYGTRGYRMGPGWEWDEQSADPNWRGGYHGGRMSGGPGQASYGWYRAEHGRDLGGHGGIDGRYDLPNGWYDADGAYHEQYERGDHRHRRLQQGGGRYGADYDPRWEQGSGIRGGPGYLRQYNAYSPALNEPGHERGWGYAPGPEEPRMLGRDGREGPLREHRHQGYNTGGFAEGKYPGPGTRQARPNR